MRYLLLCLILVGCASEVPPEPSKQKDPEVKVDVRSELKKIVKLSTDCTKYFWKNRGRAYESYMNGMALMYAKQVCDQGSSFIRQPKISSSYTVYNGTYPHKDALKYYNISGNELNTYTFLIGLGMRESNGKYCKGRDKSRNFVKGSNAEAGIFQMAYVARVFNKEMKVIYEDYKSGKKSCELDTFKSSEIKCNSYDAINHGNDEGTKWQALMKKCPAFATEWAAVLIRSNYKHFGPIIRKEVEFRNQCKSMLVKVENLIKDNCKSL